MGGNPTSEVTYSCTIVLTDPDALSRADPNYRQFRHWVVRSCQLRKRRMLNGRVTCLQIMGLKSSPDDVMAKTKGSTTRYRPPGPGPGSGVHRYGEL